MIAHVLIEIGLLLELLSANGALMRCSRTSVVGAQVRVQAASGINTNKEIIIRFFA